MPVVPLRVDVEINLGRGDLEPRTYCQCLITSECCTCNADSLIKSTSKKNSTRNYLSLRFSGEMRNSEAAILRLVRNTPFLELVRNEKET